MVDVDHDGKAGLPGYRDVARSGPHHNPVRRVPARPCSGQPVADQQPPSDQLRRNPGHGSPVVGGAERRTWESGAERGNAHWRRLPEVDDVSTIRQCRPYLVEAVRRDHEGRAATETEIGRGFRHVPGHGTILLVLLVLLAAAAAIVAGVVAVVMGWGGEIALFGRDLPPIRFRLRDPSDIAMLRLPVSLFGFQAHATGEALRGIAALLAERDAELAMLRNEIIELRMRTAAPGSGLADRSAAADDVAPAPIESAAETDESASASGNSAGISADGVGISGGDARASGGDVGVSGGGAGASVADGAGGSDGRGADASAVGGAGGSDGRGAGACAVGGAGGSDGRGAGASAVGGAGGSDGRGADASAVGGAGGSAGRGADASAVGGAGGG